MAAHWSNLPKEHKLAHFSAELSSILENAGHNEMYGVELAAPTADKPAPHTTLIILQKYLRANVDDLEKAKEQLTAALKWRKEYQPLKAKDDVFDADKFASIGYVTKVKAAKETPNEEDIACFNIYGNAAKESKKIFGDTDAFIRWRVALQELAISQLNLNSADKPIPDYGKGPDPYKMIAVHDYLSVSFFRQPAESKASSQKIIDMFQRYYPETVSYKYVVNVPTIMQWMMGAMKMLMSKDSIQTMTWMTYGNQLYQYLGTDIPKEYGGTGATLAETAITPKYDSQETEAAKPAEAAIEGVPAAEVGSAPTAQVVAAETPSATNAAPEVTGKPEEKATVA
ncbi:Phosphatidylinositol transfer protein SFH5 [Fulvia fulva]|uniref:Phosphatidylinositol transfer protein SFH5 n=1 Tax=Passalora fulva TaxID=5499 RepID=A0A9Q8PCI1_PASFU|nr:Phosphatidylinositol transfer protein SFH5 [Fulvia fulva]KAK4620009.1 Phosphatidylinositol transfer protein SFH5 [Fulvia fulva]KAK4621177.1 Phosphatidylinositol transfer protein SFH5 [Fulvia fulva]UJO19953.1 Phosphatidylinositol transfer protein SFH5 [Fulvia fulva]WPV17285.1 Phosphatidylinositol transfer protein SFH5 [Fulvia fulva]WPV32483.1 Phosphatidylinositol transfer protein SFH5 [Fulvia fulva]